MQPSVKSAGYGWSREGGLAFLSESTSRSFACAKFPSRARSCPISDCDGPCPSPAAVSKWARAVTRSPRALHCFPASYSVWHAVARRARQAALCPPFQEMAWHAGLQYCTARHPAHKCVPGARQTLQSGAGPASAIVRRRCARMWCQSGVKNKYRTYGHSCRRPTVTARVAPAHEASVRSLPTFNFVRRQRGPGFGRVAV